MRQIPGALRSLLWPSLDTISTFVVGIGTVLVIARLIGDNAFGLGAVALSLVLIVLVVINSLVHDAIICQEELTDAHMDSAFTASMIAAAAATICMAFGAPSIGALLGYPNLQGVIWAFLPLLLLNGCSTPLIAERRRALRFDVVGRHQIIGRFLGVAVGLGAAWFGAGVWSYVAVQCVTAAYLAAAAVFFTPRLPSLRFSWRLVRPMLFFCQPIIVSQFLSQGLARFLVIGMGYWHGLAAAGYWGVATRLSDSVVGGATQAVYNVALAYLSRLRASSHALGNALRTAQNLAMLAAVPALAALAAISGPLINLLLGPTWAPVAPMLLWSLLGSFLLLRRMLPSTALRAYGRSNVSTFASLADILVGGAAIWAFGSQSPLALAAIAGLAAIPGYIVIAWMVVRVLNSTTMDQYVAPFRDLAIAASAYGVGIETGKLLSHQSSLSLVLLQGGAAFLVALVLMALSSPRTLSLLALRRPPSNGPPLRRAGDYS